MSHSIIHTSKTYSFFSKILRDAAKSLKYYSFSSYENVLKSSHFNNSNHILANLNNFALYNPKILPSTGK